MKPAAAKNLVTVQSVRAANSRIMSKFNVATTSSQPPSVQVTMKIRDLSVAGRVAMQSLKK